MSYVFYPGCSLEGTAKDFHRSRRWRWREALGLDLPESAGLDLLRLDRRAPDRPAAGLRPAGAEPGGRRRADRGRRLRRLLQPAQDGQPRDRRRRRGAARQVADALGADYDGSTPVLHLLEILRDDVGLDVIAAARRGR